MAQVAGGPDFDFVWDDKANCGLILLREASLALKGLVLWNEHAGKG
jgi:hypothetical protein